MVTSPEGEVKPRVSRHVVKAPRTRKYQLNVHVYQAKNLTAWDDNGLSDAYVIVRIGGVSARTETKPKSLSPIWYTTLTMNVDLPHPITLAPELQLVVSDLFF